MNRVVQGVSFSPGDSLIPKVKALVRERKFSSVCRQALAAWFAREEEDGDVLTTLKRIELRLAGWDGNTFRAQVIETVYGPAVQDIGGTDKAASALDSY